MFPFPSDACKYLHVCVPIYVLPFKKESFINHLCISALGEEGLTTYWCNSYLTDISRLVSTLCIGSGGLDSEMMAKIKVMAVDRSTSTENMYFVMNFIKSLG